MFVISSNRTGRYNTLYSLEEERSAVHIFSQMVDDRTSSESLKVEQDGELLARKTPKGHFFCDDWATRADRAL